MDRFMIFRTCWEELEKFYKNVDGGLKKVERMKRFSDTSRRKKVFGKYYFTDYTPAMVNQAFLEDRRHMINKNFVWTKKRIEKLIHIDKRIRQLQNKIYNRFLQVQKDLGEKLDQGIRIYKDYQVVGIIKYDPAYCHKTGKEHACNWIDCRLSEYAAWETMNNYTFGDGDIVDNPHDSEHFIFDAWGRWLKYDYFVKNGMTILLDYIMSEHTWSLYSYLDIINMDVDCFYIDFDIYLHEYP